MDNYIGVHIGHNSGIAILNKDGRVKFAANEERFTRKKMQGGFPSRTYEQIKEHKTGKIAISQIDKKEYYKRLLKLYIYSIRKRRSGPHIRFFMNAIKGYIKPKDKTIQLLRYEETNKHFNLLKQYIKQPLKHFDHHLCHASSAYFMSGNNESLVFTLDGQGDFYSGGFYYGKDGELKVIKNYYYNGLPIGHNYDEITAALGFKPTHHAGKITGLAAYGKYNENCIKDVSKFLDSIWQRKTVSNYVSNHYYLCRTDEGIEKIREMRKGHLGKYSDADVAFAVQYLTEKKILALLEKITENYPKNNIALAGGVFANVKVNQRIKELGFKEIFIQPGMGDEGLPLGAALKNISEENGLKPYRTNDVYFGPEYSEKEIKESLEKEKVNYKYDDNIESSVAELIAKGKVVARFNGRMEFGPRALGNRSILYQATDKSVNDWLNKRLGRNDFMPFAPVTLSKSANKCYKNLGGAEYAAKFMTITFDCTDWLMDNCPAVVHVDGTVRPQLIDKETNLSYYKILDEYRKITGLNTLVNTSFNMHEEPIVCTPEDAIKSFKQGNLDYLAIGNFLVKNK